MAKRTSSLLGRPFPSSSWRFAFAAPRFHQLIEAAVPLLSAAFGGLPFGGLPCLPPLPTLPLRRSVMVPSIVRTELEGLKGLGSSSLKAAPHSNFPKKYAP